MKIERTAAALALCALTGCVEPLTPENFGREYEDALCAWASGCGAFPSRHECREALAWDTIGRFQYLAAAADAGRVAFDADAAQECFAQLTALGCERDLLEEILFWGGPPSAPPACQRVFTGKVRNYDPCLSSEECAGENAVCGFSPNCSDACCAGSCRDLGAPPKIGEPCTGSCEVGAYCAFDPMGGPSVCAERRKAGQSCADAFNACAEGLFCDYSGQEPTCRERRGVGQACEGTSQCAEGLHCYTRGTSYTCEPLPGEGEPCAPYNYPACARADNYCDPASERCLRLPEPGQTCVEYSECVPYAQCRDSRCVARGGLGEPCGPSVGYVDCLGHLTCVDGTCKEREPEPVCEPPE